MGIGTVIAISAMLSLLDKSRPRSSIRADTWRPGDAIGFRGWSGDDGRSGRYGAGYRKVRYESWRGVSERRYRLERTRSWR